MTGETVRVRVAKTVPLTDEETWEAVYLPKRTEFDGVVNARGNIEVQYEGRTYVVVPLGCTFVKDKPAEQGPLTAEQVKQVKQFAKMGGSWLEEVTSWSGDSWTLRLATTFTDNVRSYGGGYSTTRSTSEMLLSVKKGDDKARARFEAKKAAALALLEASR